MPPDEPPWLQETLKALLTSMQETNRINKQLVEVLRDVRDTTELLRGELKHIRTETERVARLATLESMTGGT